MEKPNAYGDVNALPSQKYTQPNTHTHRRPKQRQMLHHQNHPLAETAIPKLQKTTKTQTQKLFIYLPTEKVHINNSLTTPQNNINTNTTKDTEIIYDLDALSDTSIGSKDSIYVQEINNTSTINKCTKTTDSKITDTDMHEPNSDNEKFEIFN